MKTKLLLFIILCFTVGGFSAISASARATATAIDPRAAGHTVSPAKFFMPDGSPAKDVSVSASGLEAIGASARTDQDGVFTISGLSSGNYTVSVRQEGFQNENEMLTISEGTISGQAFYVPFYLRAPGQPKGTRPANPMLKDVPKDAVAKYEKGMEKLGKNDAKGAVADFDAAIAAYPNFAAAHYEKGAALLKTSEYDKALESFVKAIQAKPDYVEAKYSVGYTQYLKKNYEVAAAVFDDVLKQKKDMPEANMYLGISLYNLRNIDAAESGLKKAISAKGGDKLALAHLYLGQIYAQKKRNAEAVVELEKYLELVPKAPNADKIKSVVADLKKKA